jgi:hypothetical protein
MSSKNLDKSLIDYLKNVVFSMDALHCQKKLSPPLSIVGMTI